MVSKQELQVQTRTVSDRPLQDKAPVRVPGTVPPDQELVVPDIDQENFTLYVLSVLLNNRPSF